MGIQGLLPQLKSIMVPIHIQDLRGQTVAVDTYSWLHKGALSCSLNICKGIPTARHINYCMHRVNLLRHYGVKPILVFDGGFLPMKTEQETKRSRARKENLERAREHESAGNSTAAFECYQKAVDISPSVALGLIKVLQGEKVDYIVAPYEADAQMTFLCMNKYVDAVITEDSDLIPFGCSRIIFKMDKFGQGVQFQSAMLGQNKDLDFSGFTKQMLLEVCILSGCDYLQSLPGMGLKRAHALVQKFKSYEKVIKHLRFSAISVPPLYEENFKKAMWAFQHQRVYNPTEEKIVHLSDVPPNIGEDLDFLGPWLPPHVVKGIAEGDLDPFTKLPFQVEATSTELILDKHCLVKESAFASGKKKLDLPVQNNVLTNYFCLASVEAKRKFRAPKVRPKCMVTMESSSPTSANHESDSLGSTASAEAASPNIKHKGNSPVSGELGNLPSKGSLILHEKTIRTPKFMPKFLVSTESSSPSSNSHESNSPSSYTDGTPTIGYQQHSVRSSDLVEDLPPKDTMVGTFSIGGNKLVEQLSQGSVVSSPDSCSPPELKNEPLRPFLTSHKERGCKDKLDAIRRVSSGLDGDKRNTKSLVRKVSPYFLNKPLDKNETDSQNEEPFINNEPGEVTGDCPVATVTSDKTGYQKCDAKKRKLLHADTLPSESQPLKHLHVTSVKEVDFDPKSNNECTNGKMEGNFGCDVSHLKKYSGIAEKSMERFASIISSFRYTSSGSRASGLRPPLKDVQNTRPVRSTAGPIDFSEYAYKPKNKSV